MDEIKIIDRSKAFSDRIMNGTIIKLDIAKPEGWNFGIVTLWSAGERYAQYNDELNIIFNGIVRALQDDSGVDHNALGTKVTASALEMFFYWVHLTPTTRGTAVAGYAALLAVGILYVCHYHNEIFVVVAMGEKIDSPIPKGKQFDWEGILTSDPQEFVSRIEPWISARSKHQIPENWLNGEEGYILGEIFNTTRKMIGILNST